MLKNVHVTLDVDLLNITYYEFYPNVANLIT